MKGLRIKCSVRDHSKLEDLHIIQGQLKELSDENYKKLRKSIEEEGFRFPIHVWPNNGVYNIIGGTHRRLALGRMKDEGWHIPEIPIIKVEADSLSHAKKLIMLETSSFASITDEGLYEFMNDVDWNAGEIEGFELEGIDNDMFMEKFFEDDIKDVDDIKNTNEEINLDDLVDDLNCTCPKCGFEFKK